MKRILVLLFIMCLTFVGFSQEKVTCIVTSNKNNFDVTYSNQNGSIEQIKVQSNSWNKIFYGNLKEIINLNIVAQTHNLNSNINIKIIYHDKVYCESNSNGDYVVSSLYKSIYLYKNILIEHPYQESFNGVMSVYSNSPIYEKPSMITSKQIGYVDNNVVEIIEKCNEKYYKVKYNGGLTGYMWSGWFTL